MKLFFHKKMSLLLEGFDIDQINPLFKTPLVFVLLAPLLMVLEVSMDLLQPRLMASIIDQGVLMRNLASRTVNRCMDVARGIHWFARRCWLYCIC